MRSQIARFAAGLRSYTDMWSAESGGYDAFTPIVAAAQWSQSLRFGTAIVPVYTRGAHTFTLREEAATGLRGSHRGRSSAHTLRVC